MRLGSYMRCMAAITCHPAPFFQERRLLFLVSHMRSYSSLFGHILGSHPDISGYSESHLRYRHVLYLYRLRLHVMMSHAYTFKGTRLFDKILHNYPICPGILNRSDITLMFALRRPAATLKSMIANRRRLNRRQPELAQPSVILEVYLDRLQGIRKCADQAKAGESTFYFDSDRLVEDTEHFLAALSKRLALDPPLSPHYSTFSYTGGYYVGDSSKYIGKGDICRERDSSQGIEIPADILARATAAYDVCRQALQNRMTVL